MEWLAEPQTWIALLSLTVLEIVLGIDNVIFISIVSGRLPREKQAAARRIGLALAVVTRLVLLGGIFLLTTVDGTLFSLFEEDISLRDLILIGGGLFLLAKSTHEIHTELEGVRSEKESRPVGSMASVIVQILILDLVFSLDSVITAIGMAKRFEIMAAAVVIAVVFMLWFAKAVSDFVDRHPTIKMLALSFLLLIGVALIGEGLDLEIPKGYIYFAMAFSFFVELLNTKLRKKEGAVQPKPEA
ncbi:MAG: TerC family protein [Planctomycetota bacterium]|nr:TerC family protein [Planctomycetota bacterium]